MRKYIFCLAFIAVFIQNSCNGGDNNITEVNDDATPLHIRLGTKFNTLRGVTLTWQSSETDDRIKWGYTTDYEFSEVVAERRDVFDKYLYDYTFPILKPQTQIYYYVKSAGKWRDEKSFITSADTLSEQFSFIIGGDSKVGDSADTNDRWEIMADLIANETADFFIHLGDVVRYNDNMLLWETYFEYGKNLTEKKLTFYSWGNHEFGSIALNNSILPNNKKWYSFTQGNTLFISLLSEEDLDIQYNWLLEQLESTDKEWIIVSFHRPFFTRGSHRDEMNDYRETWWKAFDDYGVDIVLSSHTHSYIRTYPLNLNISDTLFVEEYGSKPFQGRLELVSGGLGSDNSVVSEDWFAYNTYSGMHYLKVSINGNKLHFNALTSSGSVIDSLTILSNGTSYVH